MEGDPDVVEKGANVKAVDGAESEPQSRSGDGEASRAILVAAPTLSPRAQREAVAAAFKKHLREVTPRAWVVPSTIVANVALFLVMTASGVDSNLPKPAALLRWGANSGASTLVDHQAWRVLTSAFIHAGFAYLLFNMIALANAGFMIERIFGSGRFSAIYFCAAVTGGIASVSVHPDVVSVGASGAIFGVYGALAAFVARERGTVPTPVISSLSGIALTFIAYNLFYGFQDPNIDVAAHVGGLLGGVAAGALLSRPLDMNRAKGVGAPLGVALASLALVLVVVIVGPQSVSGLGLSAHTFPGFEVSLPSGRVGNKTGSIYDEGGAFLTHGGVEVKVGWSPGPPRFDPDIVDAIVSGLAAEFGAAAGNANRDMRIDVPESPRSQSWTVQIGARRFWFSEVACGKRRVLVRTVGWNPGIETLHRRILATLHCHPDPKQESTLGSIPVTLDDVPGWMRVPDSQGRFFELTNGRERIVVTLFSSVDGGDNFAQVAQSGVKGLHFGHSEGGYWPTTMDPNHEKGWAVVRTCPDRGQSIVAAWNGWSVLPAYDGREVLSHLRCLRADEPLREWPAYRWQSDK